MFSRAALLAAILVLPNLVDAAEGKPNNGKNVILVVADDLGFQVGCYGDKAARTPNMDRLAATGTRFTRARCTTASCSASRSVILSGRHNHSTGLYGLAHADHHFSAYDSVRSLPVLLSEADYRTCSIGKFHVAPESVYHFDAYPNQGIPGGARNSVAMAKKAIEWINESDSQPFFLYFCPTDPHRSGAGEFANPKPGEDRYPGCLQEIFSPEEVTVPSWLPDNAEVRQELAEYYQAITRVDQGLGVLLDFLESSGRDKNTMVVFLSDNGSPFPGAKTTLYEAGINLPLIVRNPDVANRGVVCDAQVNWTDLAPTILDFCGVTPAPGPPVTPAPNNEGAGSPRRNGKLVPPQFHGRSFLGVLEQQHPEGWDEVYASHSFHEITMYYPMRAVIEGDWKLIFNIAHDLPYPFASDLYESPTWQGVLKRGDTQYGQRTVSAYIHRPRFELYDLNADPGEVHNLADSEEHAATLERLQRKLQAWQKATDDPWELKWRYE
jgi:N-sulfoglucosamine sulfohydrolase